MIGRKVKRQRPTLKTAYDWLEKGTFSVSPKEHFLSEAEHDGQVQGIVDELEELAKQFPRTQNLEFAILKSHLIIENVLAQYIRYHARIAVTIDEVRFSFSHKLEIACLMGFGANDPTLLPSIQLWNRARNQVAHRFGVNKGIIDEIIRINSPADDPPPANDRQRISALRSLSGYICGYTSGGLHAEHHVSKFLTRSPTMAASNLADPADLPPSAA